MRMLTTDDKELLERHAALQSPSRIEELAKVFIHATKVRSVAQHVRRRSRLLTRCRWRLDSGRCTLPVEAKFGSGKEVHRNVRHRKEGERLSFLCVLGSRMHHSLMLLCWKEALGIQPRNGCRFHCCLRHQTLGSTFPRAFQRAGRPGWR